jgi:hypothetical protein
MAAEVSPPRSAGKTAMSFRAETYRVLIASPSDLSEERQAATEAINEWNAQHAAAEAVVLLPVKWETHATPRSGVRPQAAISQQLVGGCDMLVGMFWTRLGTDTGVAESGTVEEIDQFVGAGKLRRCAQEFRRMALLRNALTHAHPATDPDGSKRLHCWNPSRSVEWPDEAVENAARQFDDAVAELSALYSRI